jgi:hypothetical protein
MRGWHVLKKIYSILAIIGVSIWSATIFLRNTGLMEFNLTRTILLHTPNFGAVWAGVGMAFICYPIFFKKEFELKYFYHLIGLVLLIMLASEIIHFLYLGSPFDIWDLATSVIASMLLTIVYEIKKRKNKMTTSYEVRRKN